MSLPLPMNGRDRRVLAVGAAVAILLLGWALVWEPLRLERAVLRDRVAANADLLAAARRLPPTTHPDPTAVVPGASLLARADASARAAGLGDNLGSIEPQGLGALRVQLHDVAFDALGTWLQSLANAGIGVESLSVQRAAGAGRVDARVVLRDAGP